MQNFSTIIPATFLILILCLSCNSAKQLPMEFPGIQLIFGAGGGVTGQAKIYYILENGMVFQSQGIAENTIQKYGRIPEAEVKSIIKNYDVLKLMEIDFDHPGNIYHFIEWKHGVQNHKITWGDNSFEVDQKVKLLYELLNHKIRTIKTK